MNKNCPFCGKDAVIDTLNHANGRPSMFRVKCQICGAATEWYETANDAWAAWNMRETSSAPKKNLRGKRKRD
jgi:Lar family restriction alleviation protein